MTTDMAKHALAWGLRCPPGSWLLEVAQRFLPSHQPIGVLAVILDHRGHVLLLDHVARGAHPTGLPGGWLNRAERPEDGLSRELSEELRIAVTSLRYLLSAQHLDSSGRARGLTLVYHANVPPEMQPRLSAEVVSARWFPPDEAVVLLRDFEADAVRLAARA